MQVEGAAVFMLAVRLVLEVQVVGEQEAQHQTTQATQELLTRVAVVAAQEQAQKIKTAATAAQAS